MQYRGLTLLLLVVLSFGSTCLAQDDTTAASPKVVKVTTVTTVKGTGRKPMESTLWLAPEKVRLQRQGAVVVLDLEKEEGTWRDGDTGVVVTYTFKQLADLRRRYPSPLRIVPAAGEVTLERTDRTMKVDGVVVRKVVLTHGPSTLTAWVDESTPAPVNWGAVDDLLEIDGLGILRQKLRESVKGVPLRVEVSTTIRDIPVTVTERSTVEKVDYDKALFVIETQQQGGEAPAE